MILQGGRPGSAGAARGLALGRAVGPCRRRLLRLLGRSGRCGWAQGLIREQQGNNESRVGPDRLPAGIRDHLSWFVGVGGPPGGLPRIRIELGGGHYHYGVVVYPTGSGPPAEWWQRAMGWPP